MPPEDETEPEPVLLAYRLPDTPDLPIVPAPARRDWWDGTTLHYAYRCLPLLMANQNGWWVLNDRAFTVRWNGGTATSDLCVRYADGGTGARPAMSHFGHGILTFQVPYLFRTPPGWNLVVRGPANLPKDGAHPLEGLVETDWAVATFTMNWKITRPGAEIGFEAGEPFLMLLPQRRGELERFRAAEVPISRMPDADDHRAWHDSRMGFAHEILAADAAVAADMWQRHYMRGTHPAADQPFPGHQRRLRLRDFSPAPTDSPTDRPADSPTHSPADSPSAVPSAEEGAAR
ncbi:DUF6065 family protein [Streptomyces yaizuensis]|uniref:DUF6065 family protein n=1 Tax=Streptomyces yaizuensis TaxID=2989713 RepID=A0ABQ5NQF9_9ACTN|nr:DUF6065 family protein [Streptomyces sp. YSPA8]GLF92624.1 DUF6065 family protein [Streptomyces sp. YSPA8]